MRGVKDVKRDAVCGGRCCLCISPARPERSEWRLAYPWCVSKERSTKTRESFSDVLKALRATRGMSQHALAQAVGVTDGLVGAWETDRRQPSQVNLEKIPGALRLTGPERTRLFEAFGRGAQTLRQRPGVSPPSSAQGLSIDEIQAIAARLHGLATSQHDARDQLAAIREQLALPAGITGVEAISERLRKTLELSDGLEGHLHELADVFSEISERLDAIGQRLSSQFG